MMIDGITSQIKTTEEFVRKWLEQWHIEVTPEKIKQYMDWWTKQKQYLTERQEIVKEFDEKLRARIFPIQREYENQKQIQAKITRTLSRVSPVACFNNIVAELANTGILQLRQFQTNVGVFQDQWERTYYHKIHFFTFGHHGAADAIDDIDFTNLPRFKNSEVSLESVLAFTWSDMLLLVIYGFLFFAIAYVAFLRYDVR